MVIVDAPYLTYRAYCSGGPEAVAKATVSTLLQFMATDADLWLVWEAPQGRGPELRRALYSDYKCRREPKPAAYLNTVEDIKKAVSVVGVSQAVPRHGEGDDAAWTLCHEALAQDDERDVTLWSRDKDWLQMLTDDRVSLVLPAAGGQSPRVVRGAGVPELLGVPAELVPSYLALAGDTADDVPGMAGIGAKRAAELLAACPQLVPLVLGGRGEEAVRQVAATSPTLAKHAQTIADSPATLELMLQLVGLQLVELEREPGSYDAGAAKAALRDLDCGWAVDTLSQVAPDDWT